MIDNFTDPLPPPGRETLQEAAQLLADGIVRLSDKRRYVECFGEPLDFRAEGSVCEAPTKKEKVK